MGRFVKPSGDGLAMSEDSRGEALALRLQKSEQEKREWGSTPPTLTSKLFPPALSCDIYLLGWFCQKPSGWAVPPPPQALWYVAGFLADRPQRKKGRVGGQPETPPEEKHGSQSTHRNSTQDSLHTSTLTHKGVWYTRCECVWYGGGDAGWGIRHWLSLKGQWFISSTIWRNMAHI